jgi:hypothetical protein
MNIRIGTRTLNIINNSECKIIKYDKDCKYVDIFTHHVGSIGAPSRRTVVVRGTNAKR